MQTIIKAQVVDQAMRVTSLPKLASGGAEEIRVEVTFCSMWDGMGKTAVFYRNKGKVYQVVMVEDACIIPYEVMAEPGKVYFGVVGVEGETVRTSEVVALTVQQGSIIAAVPVPLPDVYKQILTAYGNLDAAVKAEKVERKAEVAVERARIDNLVKNGSTSDDAELIDIRVSYDGVTYDSAGEAVRALGEDVETARYNASRPNLINLAECEYGYYNTSGEWASGYANLEMTSAYIEILPGEKYTVSLEHPGTAMFNAVYVAGQSVPGSWARFLFYDADKTLLSTTDFSFAESKGAYTVTAPETASYVRVSWRHYYATMQIKLEQGDYLTAIGPVPSVGLAHKGYYSYGGAITQDDGTAPYTTMFSLPVSVEGGAEYTVYNLGEYSSERWAAISFFDAAGEHIERFTYDTVAGNDVRQITTPGNAAYAGLTARIDHLTTFAMYKAVSEREKPLEQRYLDMLFDELNTVNPATVGFVKAVAHRGYSSEAPENTLPAYRLAKKKGFEYVECDVSFTSDGVAVLLHDSTIDRTSTGTGSISGLTFDEVRALDFGSWFGEEYAGTVIPTFEEFILLCRNVGLHPYVELKAGTEEQITALVSTVEQYGMLDNTTWISFSADYLSYVKNAYSKARLGYVISDILAANVTTAQSLQTGENEVFIDSSVYNTTAMLLYGKSGLPMEVWTINDAATIQTLPPYVSGVTSDSQHAGRVLCEYSMEV